MDIKNNNEFYTEAQLSKCIEIPIYTVTEGLNKFVNFKGLLTESVESTPFYVDGYLIIDETSIVQTGEDEYEDSLTRARCSKYCSRPELANNSYIVSMRFLIEEAFINYSEFKNALKKFGIPLTEEIENVQTKDFNYEVNLVNRKSNFTLDDAAKIAANMNLNGFSSSSLIKNHYMELLSDCIKGTNQDGFKLHTVELWCSNNDEFGERYSKTYDNGSYLKQRAVLDYQLTIISKQEFVRWCEYEDIDTGLTIEDREFEESIEALKAENSKLKAQIRPQGFQQAPPARPDNKNNEEVELLNREIKQLTEELELLKKSSFPIMTPKLKAALKAQNNFWLSYDESNPPLQKAVTIFIEKELRLDSLKTNRDAQELTRAIQPQNIKRK